MKNRYPGVNPHLNSFLQGEGGWWKAFHTEHLESLRRYLRERLPAGYLVFSEKSLQGSEVAVVPDVTVFTRRTPTPAAPLNTQPTLSLPIQTLMDEEDLLNALVVYHASAESGYRAVLRIELMSPANKPGHSYHLAYLTKRYDTLITGLRLMEIDYLHETPPMDNRLPKYPQPQSFPYVVYATEPNPSVKDGMTDIYTAHVSTPLPTALMSSDTISFDFTEIYNDTFDNSDLPIIGVDYTQLPQRFHTYSDSDQAYIRQRMSEIGVQPD
jgi:hypothetical protein